MRVHVPTQNPGRTTVSLADGLSAPGFVAGCSARAESCVHASTRSRWGLRGSTPAYARRSLLPRSARGAGRTPMASAGAEDAAALRSCAPGASPGATDLPVRLVLAALRPVSAQDEHRPCRHPAGTGERHASANATVRGRRDHPVMVPLCCTSVGVWELRGD